MLHFAILGNIFPSFGIKRLKLSTYFQIDCAVDVTVVGTQEENVIFLYKNCNNGALK
jgi:hypothetical protein